MEQENPKEIEVTLDMVLEFLVSAVLVVSGLVALFALIWAKWTAFKVALTVFVAVSLATAFGYHIADRRRRNKK